MWKWTPDFLKAHFSLFVLITVSACSQQQQTEQNLHPNISTNLSRYEKGDLIYSVYTEDFRDVLEKVQNGADVNENIGSTDLPVTPLLVAIHRGDALIVRLLLSNGANPKIRRQGYTPYQIAILTNQPRVAEEIRRFSTGSEQ